MKFRELTILLPCHSLEDFPSDLPDEAAAHADAIAIGDGVQLWPQILEDIERGELRPRYTANYARQYRLDPAPRRSLLPRESFLTTTSVIAIAMASTSPTTAVPRMYAVRATHERRPSSRRSSTAKAPWAPPSAPTTSAPSSSSRVGASARTGS